MAFTRIVEVFPPLLPAKDQSAEIDPEKAMDCFVSEVASIERLADLVLVASVKKPHMARASTLEAACVLSRKLNVKAAPVVVVRDSNRVNLRSEVQMAVSNGVHAIALMWGDPYTKRARASRVADYRSLSEAIADARSLGSGSRSGLKIVAPLDLSKLGSLAGRKLAESRIDAGAEMLLAQPPTTDSEDLSRHRAILESAGLKSKVMLSVFPFRNRQDVLECQLNFRWNLPRRLSSRADRGRTALLQDEREVVSGLRSGGHPGVYVSTRGAPSLAAEILG